MCVALSLGVVVSTDRIALTRVTTLSALSSMPVYRQSCCLSLSNLGISGGGLRLYLTAMLFFVVNYSDKFSFDF